MKIRVFLVFFTVLRLQIYEAIAAIFWQYASYVIGDCSQTKFVAIILVLLVFFAIFRLTNFSSDAFDFSSSKTG